MSGEVTMIGAFRNAQSFFRLGPPAILLTFAQAMTGIVLTDLIVYRTCLVSLNINYTECIMLRTDSGSPEAMDLEAKVEPHASMIIMAKSLLESILPAVISLFLGSWSDRGGRRPLLLAGFSGFTLMYFSLPLLSEWHISPWYFLCSSIPMIIVGGSSTLILASICCISDTAVENDRMVQLTMIEASTCGGELLGTLIGPFIYKNYGYSNIFRTALVCCASALIYVYFRVPETVKDASKESIRGLFKTSSVKKLVTSPFVKREGFDRLIVWLGIFTFTLLAMVLAGEHNIGFLFTRTRLGWNVTHFSFVTVIGIVLRITGLCVVSFFAPLMGASDQLLVGLGLLSALGGAITRSLTWKSWHVYAGIGIEVFSGVIGPATRSIISKAVPPEDVGKVFSLTAFFEVSSPLAAAPLFTLIYSNYLPPIYPSRVHFLYISIYVLMMLAFVCIHLLLSKAHKLTTYTPAPQDDNPS